MVVLAMCALLLASGCGKEEKETPKSQLPLGPVLTDNRGPMPTGDGLFVPGSVPPEFRAARRTFDRTCAKCHSLDASRVAAGDKGTPPFKPPEDKGFGGFKGMMPKGPNLAKVAANPAHTRDWLVAYIRDPRAQNPKSRMPPFEGKLNAEELGALADYLSSLK
jgi:cytochrome c2